MFRWLVKYRWKDFDKGYNFALDLTLIGGFHTKLWDSKVARVPILGIWGLPFGSFGTKWHLGASPVARHKEYYKGEGGGFPQVQVVVSLVKSMLVRGSFMQQKCSDYALTNLLFGLCRSLWVIDLLDNLPSLDPRAPTCPSTPKCYKLGSAPNSFSFCYLHLWTHNWVHQGAWSGVNKKWKNVCW